MCRTAQCRHIRDKRTPFARSWMTTPTSARAIQDSAKPNQLNRWPG
jgi:hypothetical protein